MHLHLDVVGGIAGDMFAATVLDAWPELEAELKATLDGTGVGRLVTVARKDFDDGVLVGSQVSVVPATDEAHHHRSFRDIRTILREASLDAGVLDRALAIFTLLAEAESTVHGKDIEEVAFHEVGAWDSIADVVMAAWLLDHLHNATWSCSPVPAGKGMVNTVHGRLPVPTPATAHLIRGMPVYTDHVVGDRITPTGAAILRHIDPDFDAAFASRRDGRRYALAETGVGFGTSRFDGISNMLRMSVYRAEVATADAAAIKRDTVTVIEFEVDDQSPEDLAVGLDNLRALDGVIDVLQHPVFIKKGRVASQIQVLAQPASEDAVAAACFSETTTLGLRCRDTTRQLLRRAEDAVDVQDAVAGTRHVRYKRATRPTGSTTVKAEMDDIGASGLSYAERSALRRRVETRAEAASADAAESTDSNAPDE